MTVLGSASLRSENAVVKSGRARIFRFNGQFDAAILLYESVLEEFPNDPFALCGRAAALRAKGLKTEALAAYGEAAQRCPFTAEPLIGKAAVLRDLDRLSEAAALYDQGAQQFPNERAFAVGRAIILQDQGRYHEALALLDQLIARFPFDIRIRTRRAAVLTRLGAYPEAMSAFDAILHEHPSESGALLGKVALHIKLQEFAQADHLLPRGNPRTRFDWRCLLLRAFVIHRQNGSNFAVRYLREHVSSCPFFAERCRVRDLLVSFQLGQHKKIEARRIVETNPDEVSNVVALHALADHRPGKARERLALIRERAGEPERGNGRVIGVS